MKKQLLNVGKALDKAEQKSINGGYEAECYTDIECPEEGFYCKRYICVEEEEFQP